MKRTFTFFRWLLYVLATFDERRRYDLGRSRGMHCKKIELAGNFPWSPIDVTFIKGKEPEREFLTRKEFFSLYTAQ